MTTTSTERLKVLDELADEVGSQWPDVELIAESDFEDHARECAEQMGNVPDHWPFTCIDWERAASDLQTDYTSLTFDGDTYYYRAD